jgi:hypothetical protein
VRHDCLLLQNSRNKGASVLTGAIVYVGVLGLEIAERLTVLHHIGFRQAC